MEGGSLGSKPIHNHYDSVIDMFHVLNWKPLENERAVHCTYQC